MEQATSPHSTTRPVISQPQVQDAETRLVEIPAGEDSQGQPVIRSVRNGDVIEALEVTIFPFAHSASNTFRVRLELPAGQFGLYPGMFVKAAFVVGESQRLLVPASALIRRSEVTGVYVAGEDDVVRLRQVRVGRTFGERAEVLAGLRPGERIATDPVEAGIYLKTRSARNDD